MYENNAFNVVVFPEAVLPAMSIEISDCIRNHNNAIASSETVLKANKSKTVIGFSLNLRIVTSTFDIGGIEACNRDPSGRIALSRGFLYVIRLPIVRDIVMVSYAV